MRLADKRLQDLTNKFINEFFELAAQVKTEAHAENPKMNSGKRDDSFEFNYTLAECIVHSDEGVRQTEKGGDYPLIGSGFASNIIKGFFTNSVKGIQDDVKFIIDNFNKQDEDLDYFVRDLKDNSEEKVVKNVSIDFILKGVGEKFTMDNEIHRAVSFTIHNNKSGYEGLCKIFYEDGEFSSMDIYDKGGKNKQVHIGLNCEPQIQHFKYVADINGFFLMIEQVKYGIEDMIKEGK